MQTHDNYLYARAEAELAMAEKATQPEAVRAHYTLANLYLDRVNDLGSERRKAERDQD